MKTEYLATPLGDSIDNPTYSDILDYIEKIQGWDEEHGAFWVRMDDDTVLEARNDLTTTLMKPGGQCVDAKAKNWEEVSEYFRLFLAGNRDFIK